MKQSAPQAIIPAPTAAFSLYLDYYLQRKGWSQNKLAIHARINQPQLNKMMNGNVANMRIDILTNICLALQLTLPESEDLLARAGRAFSPASPEHAAYKKLITIYAGKTFNHSYESFMLDYADEILLEQGFSKLPNNNNRIKDI